MIRSTDIYADGRLYFESHAVYGEVKPEYHNNQSIGCSGYGDGWTPSTWRKRDVRGGENG